MNTLVLAAALLAANLAAAEAPAKKEAPAKPAAAAARAGKSPAIKDAIQSLLGPCSPEMAGGKVTAVEVLDGKALNALREKEKSTKPKADPAQRFIAVSYEAGGSAGKSIRQVSTQYMLTTEQAQALLGEKLCVYRE